AARLLHPGGVAVPLHVLRGSDGVWARMVGLEPRRVGTELQHLWKRYGFSDVGFQDETFFTHTARVAAIAEEMLERDLAFTWMATMRADQGARLDDTVLRTCRRAGLRRVMIGLESGSQSMLDWMKK